MIKKILRWLVVVSSIIALTGVVFSLYSHFLVDYSLENLELTLAETYKNPNEVSPVTSNAYRGVVEGLAAEEIAQEDVDYKNFSLLELATRSFDEAVDRAGHERAKFYLGQVVSVKHPDRTLFFQTLDAVYSLGIRFFRFVSSITSYLKKSILPQKEQTFEASSILLLNQAQEKERSWQLDEAADLYRKYLTLFPTRPDRAFVTISLTHILMKQRKFSESEKLLRNIVMVFAGSEEGELAGNLLRKIGAQKEREIRIEKLKQLILDQEGTPLEEKLKFKLALEFIRSQVLDEAQEIFKELEKSRDNKIRQRAKFYLGWIYKMLSQFDEGAKVLLSLNDEKDLDRELRLGLEAQLADIYYKKRDVQSALAYYKNISRDAEEDLLSGEVTAKAWLALAEVEQANIYYVDVRDEAEAEKHLNRAKDFFPNAKAFQALSQELKEASKINLRDRAFEALRKLQVHMALDLFIKYLTYDSSDAWAHSGLGTVYILLGDLSRSRDYIQKGYKLTADEYTASAMGYLWNLLQRGEEAIALYREAAGRGPNYLPAQYNLAYGYLMNKRYQEALVILRRLAGSYEGSQTVIHSKILNNWGYALWYTGEQEESKKKFREALAVTPDFKNAKKNLAQISLGQAPRVVNAPQLANPKE